MKKPTLIAMCLGLLLAGLLASHARPAHAGIGMCYEIKPICMAGQHAICVCSSNNNCFWACE